MWVDPAPMMPRTFFKFWGLAAVGALACGGVACGGNEGDGDTAVNEEEVVDVPHSGVKDQSIGNCWLYAASGWAESLVLLGGGEAENISESYLTMWHWYDQIVNSSRVEIQTGGWFNTATDLMTKYGIVREADFLPNEANAQESLAQGAALARINDALKQQEPTATNPWLGRLGTRAKRTPENVRRVLAEAFELSPAVAGNLDAAFGTGTPRRLDQTSAATPAWLRRTSDVVVGHKAPSAPVVAAKLSQVIPLWGTASPSSFGSGNRGLFRRVQKAVHDRNPVVIAWQVEWDARNKTAGTFKKVPSMNGTWDGAHMTILEDYQATRVPNLGTLRAGVQATPAEMNAALAGQAEIEFLRIKNSWGNTADPAGDGGAFTGYFDLYRDYLIDGKALMNFVLPRAYLDDGEPAGIADGCASRPDGDVCAATLTGDASNARLVRCEAGKTVSGDACAFGCQAGEGGAAAACKADGGPPPPPPPPPPGGDSCQGFCGGQSDAGCWCDGQCEQSGDCCADRAAVCG